MKINNFAFLAACICAVSPACAGNIVTVATGAEVDCDDPAKAENEVCLAFLDEGITNVVPLIAPVAGLLGSGALDGDSSPSTTTTTSTTSTD